MRICHIFLRSPNRATLKNAQNESVCHSIDMGNPRLQERVVEMPQAVALGWDVMANTEAVMDRVYAAAEEENLDSSEIREARNASEANGETFNPLVLIGRKLATKSYDRFLEAFLDSNVPSILQADAHRFLMRLQAANVPHSIIVANAHSEWRSLQVDAVGYDTGTDSICTSDKGAEIARYRGPDGRFPYMHLLGGSGLCVARTVALVDSEPEAFNGLPEDCTGFWVQRSDELLAAQDGTVPENVVALRSLDELRVCEGQLYVAPGALPDTLEQVQENLSNTIHANGSRNGYTPFYMPVD